MERKPNFIKRQVDELVDGLIAIRQSGEPFFGVQTVFAPLIDKLAQKREAQKPVSMEPSGEEKVTEYHIKTLF